MLPLARIFSFVAVTLSLRFTTAYVTLSPRQFESKIQKILEFHNRFRACHQVPPLTLDSKLIDQAQKAVQSLVDSNIIKSGKTQHRYGENLFTSKWAYSLNDLLSEKTTLKQNLNPVISWYHESQSYNRKRNPYSAEHFTQLVWKDTKKLGCGIAQNNVKFLYVLCYYEPRGNVEGHYNANVQPSKNEEPEGCIYDDFTTTENSYGSARIRTDYDTDTTSDHDFSSTSYPDTTDYNYSSTTLNYTYPGTTVIPSTSVSPDIIDKKEYLHSLLMMMTMLLVLLAIIILLVVAFMFFKIIQCCMLRRAQEGTNQGPKSIPQIPSPTQMRSQSESICRPPSSPSRPLSPQNLSLSSKSTEPEFKLDWNNAEYS